ncbi:UDP-galactopyranose mutase [Lacticaseibacillus hulanensis]|uniref:UDP-galactopyranose mutase n=1 Tax=Lacticaseibacillus hulanensis TaxID=2493111 RepID=UPI003BAC5BE5
MEEQAISLIGNDIYEKFIKGYTKEQWDRKAPELPALIVGLLPGRLTFGNKYFNHWYQGVPVDGYTQIFDKLLDSPLVNVRMIGIFLKKRLNISQSFQRLFTIVMWYNFLLLSKDSVKGRHRVYVLLVSFEV